MSITASSLVSRVSVEGAEASTAKLLGVGKASESAGGMLKSMALGGLAIAGAALIGIGVASVKMAGDFAQGILSLRTGAGELQSNLDMVSSGILGMSVKTGTSTKDLIAGMYMIESAGYHGAAGLAILQAAAEGAKVGSASLADVSNGVTTAMVDYAKSGLTATDATNTLIAAVSLGKTHMGDLAAALSTILPTAAAARVSFRDVAGAMATMTGEGTDAASAATYLRQLLIALEAPGSKATKTLREIGLTSAQVSDEMKISLPGALQMITDALKKKFPEGSAAYVAALKDIAGGSRQMQGLLELTGSHLKTFGDNVKGIAGAVKAGAGGITGWALVQQDFNFKMEQGKAAIGALLITLGTALLPVLSKIADAVLPVVTQFTAWLTKSGNLQQGMGQLQIIMKPLVDAIHDIWTQIQPLLKQVEDWAVKNHVLQKTVEFVKVAFEVWAAYLKFLVPLIINIVVEIVKFVSAIVDRLQPTISALSTFIAAHWEQISAITQGVWDHISGIISIAWALIKGIVLIGIDILSGHWGQAWNDMKDMLGGVWDGIKQTAMGGVKAVLGLLALIPGPIGDMAKKALQSITNMSQGSSTAMETMKLTAIGHAEAQAKMTIAHMEQQKKGILAQLAQTKDPHKRAQLEMQLEAINAAERQQYATIAKMEKQKAGILHHITDLKKHSTSLWGEITSSITGIVSGVVKWLQDAWHNVTQWIVSKFEWLYNHNYYFKWLVDTIRNVVANCISWLQTAWHNVTLWLAKAWNTIVDDAKKTWSNIAGVFSSAWNNYIAKPLGALWDSIVKFASGWPTDAAKWGAHLIQGLIDGITGMLDNLRKTMGNVAGDIAKFLGFHSPTELGPGRYADTWMPNLMRMLTAGIQAGIPSIHAAVSMAVAPIARFSAPSSGSFVPSSSAYAFPAMQAQAPIIIVNVQSDVLMDGQKVTRVIAPHLVNAIRASTGVKW